MNEDTPKTPEERAGDLLIELFDPQIFADANEYVSQVITNPETHKLPWFLEIEDYFENAHPRDFSIHSWPKSLRRYLAFNDAFVPANAQTLTITLMIGGVVMSRHGLDKDYYPLDQQDQTQILQALLMDYLFEDREIASHLGVSRKWVKPGRRHIEIQMMMWLAKVQSVIEARKFQASAQAAAHVRMIEDQARSLDGRIVVAEPNGILRPRATNMPTPMVPPERPYNPDDWKRN